ncbi:TetR family transcriptional regulator [Nocardia takedensis]|uniref:TetR family transcriptional regulator n=1 Tax=Nocardia takedensis TaxID=259390 RepID=UPI0002E8F1CC|nr:TetR family transcriptional regulator [Nocardia takedensis]
MARTLVADHAGRSARERILASALTVFAERGYAGASLYAIAKRAGLSQAGLLHHFPDKMSLLLAVLEQHDDTTDLPADGRERSVSELLELLVATVEKNLAHRAVIRLAHICALGTGEGADIAAGWSRQRMARIRTEITTLGRRSEERGEIPVAVDVDRIVGVVIAAFVGLEHQWLLDEEFDMVAGMTTFVEMLRAGLGLREPGPVAPM